MNADVEFLTTIDNGIPLWDEWGERFNGWYLFLNPLDSKTMDVEYSISHEFKVFDYCFRFFMPAMFIFRDGFITYDEGHRKLGIFRYPRGSDGTFRTPLKWVKEKRQINDLSEEEVQELINIREVVTFEAFRVPMFGFEYPLMNEGDFKALEEKTCSTRVEDIKKQYEEELLCKKEEVKNKILSAPDYLLILRGVLDLRLQDMTEISLMTDDIISTSR